MTLSAELETAILTLSWWSWDPFTDAHKKMIEDLKVFYKSYDRLPITRGKLPNETQLAFWINNRRAEKNRGTLSDDLKIMIATLPWWSWGNDT
jgi:hypothetical protein